MKLTTCFDSYLIDNGLWVYKFNVENVDKKYVKEAKQIDGDNYWDKCFALRVYYQEVREDEKSYLECSLLYTTNEGDDLEFDYNPTKEEEKWLYDYVEKENK